MPIRTSPMVVGGTTIEVTDIQRKKISRFLEHYKEKRRIREALELTAEEMGLTRQAVEKAVYNKKFRDAINRAISAIDREEEVKNVEGIFDVDTASVTIAWIISQLKQLYETTEDERLKKDLLMGLAKINTQYGDVLAQDMKKIKGMSLSDLIDMAVDILSQISQSKVGATVVERFNKKHGEKKDEA